MSVPATTTASGGGSFWDSLSGFVEGAWETVNPIVTQAVNQWTQQQTSNQTSQQQQLDPPNPNPGQTAAAPSTYTILGQEVSQTTLFIGGGFAVLFLLVLMMRR